MINDLFITDSVESGIGYQEYRNLRKQRENISSSQLEDENNKRFIVYFGRMHLTDYKSNTQAVGLLKVGKTWYPTSIMRARNEAGAEFRLYAEIVLNDAPTMNLVEKRAHKILEEKSIAGKQGQQELFDVDNDELETWIHKIAADVLTPSSIGSPKIEIDEILAFDNNQHRNLNVPQVNYEDEINKLSNGMFV